LPKQAGMRARESYEDRFGIAAFESIMSQINAQ
jgi:hypothetical protein